MLKKAFVLDTNVLIHDPNALTSFEDNDLVIPLTVMKELDGLKKGNDEVARSSRYISRIIWKLVEQYPDSIRSGMRLPLPASGKLKIFIHNDFDKLTPDEQIIKVAQILKEELGANIQVVVVSKDTNLRIIARALGITAEDYEKDRVPPEHLYTGISTIVIAGRTAFVSGNRECKLPPEFMPYDHFPNECVILKSAEDQEWLALTTYDAESKVLRLIRKQQKSKYQVAPKNPEQMFAYDLLMNEQLPFVTLVGKAGTGKDLMSLLAGLEGLGKTYKRIIISSAAFSEGNKKLGFLPGTLEEKLDPWIQPFFDNIDLLYGSDSVEAGSRDKARASRSCGEEFLRNDQLVIASTAHIRGRSFHNSFIIISEAQNLTPLEAKTAATRIGKGSKMVFTGDLEQIDVPYLDSSSCGLTRLVELFKYENLAGHVRLVKSERSEAAEMAANVL